MSEHSRAHEQSAWAECASEARSAEQVNKWAVRANKQKDERVAQYYGLYFLLVWLIVYRGKGSLGKSGCYDLEFRNVYQEICSRKKAQKVKKVKHEKKGKKKENEEMMEKTSQVAGCNILSTTAIFILRGGQSHWKLRPSAIGCVLAYLWQLWCKIKARSTI